MKTIIRPGDKVRVLRDRFIERIGYSLVWWMFEDEVESDPRTADALRALGWQGNIPRSFVIAVAKMRVEERGFGGNERKIFYHETGGYGRWPGCVLEVYSKRIAKTGTRFPPSGGIGSDGEYWDYPGGLENCRTHIILNTDAGEIEACDVELVTRA